MAIWNGLHNPELSPEKADVTVLGIPYDRAVSLRPGAAEAPDRIRAVSSHISPTTEDGRSIAQLKVFDAGNLAPLRGQRQEDYFNAVSEKALELFPHTFPTFIGGDHSVSIPLIRAAAETWGDKLGVVHIDAHLDLCAEMGGNNLSHGCAQRRNIETRALDLDQVCFVGIRSFEEQELSFLAGQERDLKMISAETISRQGIPRTAAQIKGMLRGRSHVYLTIDIDFLDPAFAPGTGTPKPGGFSTRDLLNLLKNLSTLPLVGMDLVEVSPPLDHGDITSFAAQRIITETWGLFPGSGKAERTVDID